MAQRQQSADQQCVDAIGRCFGRAIGQFFRPGNVSRSQPEPAIIGEYPSISARRHGLCKIIAGFCRIALLDCGERPQTIGLNRIRIPKHGQRYIGRLTQQRSFRRKFGQLGFCGACADQLFQRRTRPLAVTQRQQGPGLEQQHRPIAGLFCQRRGDRHAGHRVIMAGKSVLRLGKILSRTVSATGQQQQCGEEDGLFHVG